ncbi:MAG: hypothetical protein K8E24_013660, partial [Methanobacterium paludis]|nr:hypothetical protein [Methanobacterium paludis]
ENTIFSMATFDGYSAYASKLAPFVDWYMPEIYRYTKYDPDYVSSRLTTYMSEIGSNTCVPLIITYQSDMDRTNTIWDINTLSEDLKTCLNQNLGGVGVWAYPWIPTGFNLNKNIDNGSHSIMVQTGGVSAGEGVQIPINALTPNNSQCTSSIRVKAPLNVELTLKLGSGASKTFTATGGWDEVFDTQIPTDQKIYLVTSSATAATFYVDTLMVNDGSILNSWSEPERMTGCGVQCSNYNNLLEDYISNGGESGSVVGVTPDGGRVYGNILVQGGVIDSSCTGYIGLLGSTISQTSDYAWEGTTALKCITPNVAIGEGFSVGTNSADEFAINPGDMYTGSLYIRGTGTVTLTMAEYASDGTTLITSNTSAPLVLNSTWQRLDTYIETTTGVLGKLLIKTTVKAANTIYADGFMVTAGPELFNFVSGGTPRSTVNVTSSSTYAHSGTYSFKCAIDGIEELDTGGMRICDNMSNMPGVTPTQNYTISGYLRGNVGGETVQLIVEEYDENGNLITGVNSVSDPITLNSTGWVRASVTRTITDGRFISLKIVETTFTPMTFYVDDIMVDDTGALHNWILGGTSAPCVTLTASTTLAQSGSYSFKCVTDGHDKYAGLVIGDSLDDMVSVTPLKEYTGCLWLYGLGNYVVQLCERDSNGLLLSTTDLKVVGTNSWQKIVLSKLIQKGTLANLKILTDGTQALTYYVDALMFGEFSSGKHNIYMMAHNPGTSVCSFKFLLDGIDQGTITIPQGNSNA